MDVVAEVRNVHAKAEEKPFYAQNPCLQEWEGAVTINEHMQFELSQKEWEEILEKIGEGLGKIGDKADLCLIGSGACIFAGMEGRTSIDLDVWKPKSKFNQIALKKAVEAAGILFDPKNEDITKPYIQIVEPGIVQTGEFQKTENVYNIGQLTVNRPPIANIVASKLVRGEPKDLEDIAYLINQFQPDREEIEVAINSMPRKQRVKAQANLVYLDVLNIEKN